MVPGLEDVQKDHTQNFRGSGAGSGSGGAGGGDRDKEEQGAVAVGAAGDESKTDRARKHVGEAGGRRKGGCLLACAHILTCVLSTWGFAREFLMYVFADYQFSLLCRGAAQRCCAEVLSALQYLPSCLHARCRACRQWTLVCTSKRRHVQTHVQTGMSATASEDE